MRAWIVLSCFALVSCTLTSARDELGAVMQREVGKTLADPDSYRAQHPKLRIGARKLANGNTEEVAAELSREIGFPADVLKIALGRQSYGEIGRAHV